MLAQFRLWIISICTAIFFITAVEMILPNNSLKKYAKFVLGLILISILINPIIKIFDKDYNMQAMANSISKKFEGDEYKESIEVYKSKNIESTLSNFKSNLEKVCEQKLQEEYVKNSFKVEVGAVYDKSKENFKIKSINVGVKEGKVDTIKKIKIDTKTKDVVRNEQVNDGVKNDIKNYLGNLLKIPKENILVYKL